MKEKPRKKMQHFDDAGHSHFLTFSCFHRLPLLTKERSILWFLQSLKIACKKLKWDLWAYVIMPEHVHLIINPKMDAYRTSEILQSLKQPVSRKAKVWLKNNDPLWYDKLIVKNGNRKEFRFWQTGGGYDRNLYSEKEVLKTIEYIHNNPVNRKLVDNPLDWKWSSARWYDCHDKLGVNIDMQQEHGHRF